MRVYTDKITIADGLVNAEIQHLYIDQNGAKYQADGDGRQVLKCHPLDTLIFESGSWRLKNDADDYAEKYNAVTRTRRQLYKNSVDPLMEEAAIKQLQGKTVEAEALQKQALALRAKIQAENPWPKQPQ